MKKQFSLKTNAVFNAIYQVLILIVPVITTPYISRVLGVDNNGIYANFYSLVQYFVLVTSFGFVDYGTKKVAEFRNDLNGKTIYFYSIFFAKLILGVICLISYIFTIIVLFNGDSIILGLIFSLYIFSAIIDPTFYFQGEERFISICIRNLIIRLLSTLSIFLFVKDENDLYIYSLVLALSQLLSVVIIIPGIKFKQFTRFSYNDLHIWNVIKESFSFFVPSLAVTLFSYVNQTLIGFFGGSDAESGYFSQSVKIIQILASIPYSLNIIMLSRISYLNSQHDEKEISEKIIKTFEVSRIISWPIMFGLCAVSKIFIPIFLGNGYNKCIVLLYILAPTIIFGPINGLYGNIFYRPRNKIWKQTYIILFSALVNLIFCLILIPIYGSIGTAIGRVIAEFLQLPLLMFFSRKELNNILFFKKGIRAFANSVIMFIIVFITIYYLQNILMNDIVLLIIAIALGAFTFLLLEIISKEPLVIFYLKLFLSKIKFLR